MAGVRMEQGLNPIDALLVLVVLLGIWGGWRSGFIVRGSELLALVGSLLVAFAVYPPVAGWLQAGDIASRMWALPLAFMLSWGVARLLIGMVLRRLVARVPREVQARRANRLRGVLPGLGQGLVDATLLAMLLLAA